MNTPEHQRLDEAARGVADWKKWGPYLSERQWGTVREDYSGDGSAWDYFTHDQARSRAYRWGEDGLAGFSDDQQLLCFALALWNGKDPVLKERLFGLTNGEGNHGEDVKEVYHYLEATPTYAYAKYLYRYPQAAFPYLDLVTTNAVRGRTDPEYELADTGVFADNRYFDVCVEYAKDAPEDILVAIRVTNRGPEPATLYVLPTLWFRNTWSACPDTPKPNLKQVEKRSPTSIVAAVHPELGVRYLYCEGAPVVHFTENETNNRRLFGGNNAALFVKDGINDHVIHGARTAVNARRTGTRAAARYGLSLEAGESRTLRLRLADGTPSSSDRQGDPFSGFDAVLATRRAEADAFYAATLPAPAAYADGANDGANDGNDLTRREEDRRIVREALAGMLWNKQYYRHDAGRWLAEHGANGSFFGHGAGRHVRNAAWGHVDNAEIIAVPDAWEYPWYTAWDVALNSLPLAVVDCSFAKEQLLLLLESSYLHPNGQLPASEWDFAAVDPPLHPFAVWSVYSLDKARRGGAGDIGFLRNAVSGLLMNFTWWTNRRDSEGRDLLSGGLLDVDAFALFDRSLPSSASGSGRLETSAGCAWLAVYCAHMLQIAVELAVEDPRTETLAIKFYDHLVTMAAAMENLGGAGQSLWNDGDGFFYDLVRIPGDGPAPLPARAFAGLLPLCACAILPRDILARLPRLEDRLSRGLGDHQRAAHNADPSRPGWRDRRLVALVGEDRLRRLLAPMLDEAEFLSPFGIRSLSQAHGATPARLHLSSAVSNVAIAVAYQPGEAVDGLAGGNVNWRGPVWMSLNTLLIQALLQHYLYYGNRLRIECPTGSGQRLTLYEIAETLVDRLAALFRRDAEGRRPANRRLGAVQPQGPGWGETLAFYEYFDAETGAGLGASHQTGATGLIAPLLRFFSTMTAAEFLERGDCGSLLSCGRREAWPAVVKV